MTERKRATEAEKGGMSGIWERRRIEIQTDIKNSHEFHEMYIKEPIVNLDRLCGILHKSRQQIYVWIEKYQFPRQEDGQFHLHRIMRWARSKAISEYLSKSREGQLCPESYYEDCVQQKKGHLHASRLQATSLDKKQYGFYKTLFYQLRRPWSWLLSFLRLSKSERGLNHDRAGFSSGKSD